ncbi:MAG: DUF1778 domain-containing protein [Gemmatimonadaceae bacterium]
MLTDTEMAYLELPADARLEVRLPSLLKQHAEVVAAAKGGNLSQLVIEAVAEKVSAELVLARNWRLSAPEQAELLRVLAAPQAPPPAFGVASQRALAAPAALLLRDDITRACGAPAG